MFLPCFCTFGVGWGFAGEVTGWDGIDWDQRMHTEHELRALAPAALGPCWAARWYERMVSMHVHVFGTCNGVI